MDLNAWYGAVPDSRAPRNSAEFSAFRRRALTSASARRELWRTHHAMTTPALIRALRLHEFHLSDYCRPYRSANLRRVSLWYVRMIRTELRARGCLAPVTLPASTRTHYAGQ
jgi:hypothetical protein